MLAVLKHILRWSGEWHMLSLAVAQVMLKTSCMLFDYSLPTPANIHKPKFIGLVPQAVASSVFVSCVSVCHSDTCCNPKQQKLAYESFALSWWDEPAHYCQVPFMLCLRLAIWSVSIYYMRWQMWPSVSLLAWACVQCSQCERGKLCICAFQKWHFSQRCKIIGMEVYLTSRIARMWRVSFGHHGWRRCNLGWIHWFWRQHCSWLELRDWYSLAGSCLEHWGHHKALQVYTYIC